MKSVTTAMFASVLARSIDCTQLQKRDVHTSRMAKRSQWNDVGTWMLEEESDDDTILHMGYDLNHQ